jgi:hypothetical protein
MLEDALISTMMACRVTNHLILVIAAQAHYASYL